MKMTFTCKQQGRGDYGARLRSRARESSRLELGQQLAHRSGDDARREGLGPILAGAVVEGDVSIALLPLGGEYEHRAVSKRRVRPHLLQDLESVAPRHHHVQHHEIRNPIGHSLQGILAVDRLFHGEARPLQHERQRSTDRSFVVHDENVRRQGWLRWRSRGFWIHTPHRPTALGGFSGPRPASAGGTRIPARHRDQPRLLGFHP